MKAPIIATLTLAVAFALAATSPAATGLRDYTPDQVEAQYQQYRACMHYLGQTPRHANGDWWTTPSFAYRRWLYLTWRTRKLACHGERQRADSDVRYAIRLVFQGPGDPRYPYDAAEQAIRVAWCESNWTTTNVTGQYRGVFQMGDSERAQYAVGNYSTIVEQVRSGYRMFVAAGRSWNRWACRPGSGGETSAWVAY